MIVADFIKLLQTQDQGATVEVVEHKDGRGYYNQGGQAYQEEFDPTKHLEYTDMRGNQFAVGKPYENKRTLLIGMIHG